MALFLFSVRSQAFDGQILRKSRFERVVSLDLRGLPHLLVDVDLFDSQVDVLRLLVGELDVVGSIGEAGSWRVLFETVKKAVSLLLRPNVINKLVD